MSGCVTLDTCGCCLAINDDGEPDTFIEACPIHAGGPESQPVAECRAKNAAVNQAAQALGIEPRDVLWGFDEARNAHAIQLDLAGGSGKALVSTAPLTAEQFVAATTAIAAAAPVSEAALG